MRVALNSLTDELRRLKSAGVTSVAVSEEGMAALRTAVAARRARARPARLVSADPVPAAPVTPPAVAPLTAPAAARRSPPGATLQAPPSIVLPAGDKATRWRYLLDRVQSDPVCLAHVRPGKRIVLGVGDLDARICLVGEAPGAEEEIQGEPFVGPAGQLLTKMIQAMGLSRSQVYIGNIMNWRPELPVDGDGFQSGNRPPTAAELAYCLPYLRAQLEIVEPELVVALGTTAAQGLLGPGTFKALGDVRGRWHEFAGKPLMVTYHPSYILRNPTNRSKRLIWEDLLKVMERAGLTVTDKQRGFFLSP